MDDKAAFLLRSDDGQLYRMTGKQLAAYKLAPNDPANAKAPQLAQAAAAARKGGTMDLVCLFVAADGASR